MAFRCPYCQFRVAVKAPPKPGRYTPACPKCKAKASLVVPADPAVEWQVSKLAGPEPRLEELEATGASLPPNPPPDPDATQATGDFSQRLPNADDRTGVFDDRPEQTAAFGPTDRTSAKAGPTIADKPPRKRAAVEIPEVLGGYEVVKELGRGGMGAVYLARQVSLDRPVALKVMNAKWANDPIFLARFTREAFAAAQLVHHNVVQIYDIGEQDGTNYFSMEFVEGRSLGDVLKAEGKLDLPASVGYMLQAARGLKFAHDRGMIHRDIKPDNLMLNAHGIVKVADLGLVKTAAMTASDDLLPEGANTEASVSRSNTGLRSLPSDITLAHTAMGSPAYMSPEQCRDAATVDARADIYSLGCTWYALLQGRPPFQGANVLDMMARHASEAPAPIAGLPPEANGVLLKSLAKQADARQQSMDEFVGELERLLPGQGGRSGPTEQQLAELEESVRKFHAAPLAKVRRMLLIGFFLGAAVTAMAGLVGGYALLTAAVVGLVFETLLAHFVVDGLFGKTYLFRRVREWAFGARLTDWATGILGLILFVVVLAMVGWLWVWLGTAVLAVGLAFAFHFLVDRRLSAQRREPIEATERMLKRLRLTGMDEEALRLFVAKNAGRSWEGFYEAMFGFESKLAVRPAVEEQAGTRLPRQAGWREGLLARIDRAQDSRRDARTRKLLQKVEAKKLVAEGVDRKEADTRAKDAAAHMVEEAAVFKVAKKPTNVRQMMVRAERPVMRVQRSAGQRLSRVVDRVLDWKLRFLVGAALVTLGALWVRQTVDTSGAAPTGKEKAVGLFRESLVRGGELRLPVVGPFVDCLNPLVAGLIVLLSVFNRRGSGILVQLVGAGIALFAYRPGIIPAAGGLEPHQLTMAVGLVLAAVGVFLSRRG